MMMVMTFKKSAFWLRALPLAIVIAAPAILSACGNANPEYVYPEKTGKNTYSPGGQKRETVFGPEGVDIFGQSKKGADQGEGGSGLGVNSFLWRASLDTVSFMPIASADPFGGVIITDWYSPPETPNERFKLNVFILGRALRADGLKIAAFRQVKDETGAWSDRAVETNVVTDLENTVLTRARKMRIAASAGAKE